MPNYRVVVDTNVIISAFLKPESLPRQVFDRILSEQTLLLSPDTTHELHQRLLDRRFDPYVTREIRLGFLQQLPTLGTYVSVTTRITACRNPRDNAFLALAVDGKADVIVTGDRDLLVLHPYEGIAIETPRAFFERMDAHP